MTLFVLLVLGLSMVLRLLVYRKPEQLGKAFLASGARIGTILEIPKCVLRHHQQQAGRDEAVLPPANRLYKVCPEGADEFHIE